MKKSSLILTGLVLLQFAAACQTAPATDYGAIRAHANESQQDLDQQRAPKQP